MSFTRWQEVNYITIETMLLQVDLYSINLTKYLKRLKITKSFNKQIYGCVYVQVTTCKIIQEYN